MPVSPAYKRILLKLSGEALMGEDSYGINRDTINRIVAEIAVNEAHAGHRNHLQQIHRDHPARGAYGPGGNLRPATRR